VLVASRHPLPPSSTAPSVQQPAHLSRTSMNICSCFRGISARSDGPTKKAEGAPRQWPKGSRRQGSSDTTSTTITASNLYRESGEHASVSNMDSVSVPIGWRQAGTPPAPLSGRDLHATPLLEEDLRASASDSDSSVPQITPEMIVYDFINEDLLASLHGASIVSF
jgi:hypothetical protein